MSHSPRARGRNHGPSLLSRFWSAPSRQRARRRLVLEFLEDRLAPAVAGNLFVAGTTLIYSGTNVDNNITVSNAGNALTISDTAGTIVSTVPGFSGGGTGTVTGNIPSYVTSVAINGNNGIDSITVPATGLTLSNRGLSMTAESIVLNGSVGTNGGAIGKDLTLSGNVFVTPAAAATNAVTISSAAAAIAGNLTITGKVFVPVVLATGGNPDALTLDATGTSALPGNVSVSDTIGLSGLNDSLVVRGNNVTLGAVQENFAGTGNLNIAAQGAVALKGNVTVGAVNGASSPGVTINANLKGSGSAGFSTTGGIITNDSQVAIATGGTGNILVNSIDTLNLADFPNSQVTLQAGGAILDGNGIATNVRSNTLTIRAGSTVNLDTIVPFVTGNGTAIGGSVTIRNQGIALDASLLSTVNSPITISNNNTLTVGDFGGVVVNGGQSLSLITTGAGSDVTLTDAEAPTGTLTITSGGSIVQSAGLTNPVAIAATIKLTAGANIGAAGTALPINAANLSASAIGTGTGVINVLNAPVGGVGPNTNLTLTQALTSGTGDVTVVSTGDLTVTGNVGTNTGNVTLTGDGAGPGATQEGLTQLRSATVAAPSGTVNLNGANLLQVDSFSTITAQDVVVSVFSPSGQVSLIDVEGTVSSSDVAGGIAINGTPDGAPNNITVGGTLAANGSVTIFGSNTTTNTNADLFNLPGKIAAGTDITVGKLGTHTASVTTLVPGTLTAGRNVVFNGSFAGTTLTKITGTVSSGGTGQLQLTGGAGGAAFFEVDGTLLGNGSGGVDLKGDTTSGVTVINIAGTIASAGTVQSEGGTTGTYTLSTTGAIAGGTVAITGGSGGTNSFNIGGAVTATAGITLTGGSVGDSFVISGPISATSTTLDGKGGGNVYVVKPSTASPFTFSGVGGTNNLVINTPIVNIIQALADYSVPITFTAASGFQTWTKAGAGTWTVTPTVP